MRRLNLIPSSNVISIWFNPGTECLRVMFGNGTWVYDPVPATFAAKLESERTSITNCLKEITAHPEIYRCQRVA